MKICGRYLRLQYFMTQIQIYYKACGGKTFQKLINQVEILCSLTIFVHKLTTFKLSIGDI